MYAKVEKPKDNKSRAVANSIKQKTSATKYSLGFNDKRPEAVAQCRLQEIIKNGSTVQCKPNNITNHRNTLTMDGTGGGEPQIVNAPAQRANRSVAYPINTMIELGIIESSDAPLTGGHLFKAEYGGNDDITNVVPWNDSAERAYSTFENAYKRNCANRARQNGGQQATIDVVASANFFSDSSKRESVANLLRGRGGRNDALIRRTIGSLAQYSSESVPKSVEVFGEVFGRKVPDLEFKSSKLIDKKNLTGYGITKLFDNVKENGWTGRPKNSIEKLSEWEDISE